MSGVRIRRAELTDREAVIDGIGDVYWGLDYLPDLYTQFVTHPDFLSFVAVDGQEVIGFYSAHIHDGGLAVCKRAARVKKQHDGTGVLKLLTTHLEREVRQLTTVRRESMTCGSENAARISESYKQRKGLREVMRMQFLFWEVAVGTLPSVERSQSPNVAEMTSADLEALFAHEQSRKRIFPQDILSSFFVPFRCRPENMAHFINDRASCVASYRADDTTPGSDVTPHVKTVTSAGDVEKITLLSASFVYRARKGHSYNVTFFGTEYADLEAHLFYHVHKLQRFGHETVILSLVFLQEFAPLVLERTKTFLGQFGITRSQYPAIDHSIFFESDFGGQ
ncbi:histidine N-acetyltransferase [Aplysia californica]|uniref:Histidine N-acetyltransferase n=1 Tax=Aplysia californica TaxID=6500 RepID=A0ABM1AF01_APLCA|nr:histidine N-acetyltransferase [Aplysia californica]